MNAYDLTPLAKADILESWAWIAADSEDPADRVEQAITTRANSWPSHRSVAIPGRT
jgi:plasmid stabilization system protein ParE